MAKIIILGSENSTQLASELGAVLINVPNISENVTGEVPDFVSNNLKQEFDVLIIDAENMPRKEDKLALAIGMYVRLSCSEIGANSLAPIIIASDKQIKSFLHYKPYSQLLLTENVYFQNRNNILLEPVKPLEAQKYKENFLEYIHIQPGPEVGRHSIANLWGAYVLSRITNNTEVFEESRYQNRIKSLYFKYVLAKHPGLLSINGSGESFEKISNTGKKILLIDDEAKISGWDKVFKGMFLDSSSQFDVIDEKVKDYKSLSVEARQKIEDGGYDLFLLDLRMNGVEEEDVYDTKKFSGYDILTKIKTLNRGNQVIMFTASNKAWNLKRLLQAGANGYYIKESPEFGFSDKFSIANYNSLRRDIENCLDDRYLKDVYLYKREIDKCLDKQPFVRYNTKQKSTEKYHRLIKEELSACFNILNSENSNRQYHALLMMYKVVEYICDIFYNNDAVIDGRFSVEFYYPDEGTWHKKGDSIPNRKIEGQLKPIVDDKDMYSTKNKCFNIVKYVWPSTDYSSMKGLFDVINDLSITRNSYVHVKRTELPNVSHGQLVSWIKAISTIVKLL